MNALARFESASDAAFAAHPLPHPNGYVSAWYLLTVSEDSQRLMLLREDPVPEWRVEHYLDRFKFSLRNCLQRVRAESKDKTDMPLPDKAMEKLYVRAQTLLLSGIDYSLASQICSSAYNGSIRLSDDGENFRVELIDGQLDLPYSALEAMRQSAGEVVIPLSSLFWFWIRHEERRPPCVWQIMESTRLQGRHIRYEYNPELAYELSKAMPQAPYLIPEEWLFEWGGRSTTTLLLNSLSLRAMYHLVAIQFGAQKYNLKGGAEHDLCLVLQREEWIIHLELMNSIEREKIGMFVDYLTYGYKSLSPDQALQPLVPLGAGRLGLGPLGWLSSNVERNLLSLQARLNPRELNRQSGLFEVQMINSLLKSICERWSLVVSNRTFALARGKEEFDILICERETKTILNLELRWMLSPADPREIQQKKQACWEKVEQAERKADAVRNGIDTILHAAFGLANMVGSDWAVFAIVVVEGFGGARSHKNSIPVIPEWVLEAGVREAPSLRRLVDWVAELDWLPAEGREFDVFSDSEPHLDEVTVRYPGFAPRCTGREFLVRVVKSMKALH